MTLAKYLSIALIYIVSLCIGITYFIKIPSTSYHIDEFFFLKKSEFFELFFIKKDTQNILWEQLDPSQPKIGVYLFGAVLYAHQVGDLNTIFKNANFTLKTIEAISTNKLSQKNNQLKPIYDLILIARQTGVLFSIASFIVLGIYLHATKATVFRSLLNIVLLSQNFVMLAVGNRTLTDTMQLFALITTLALSSKLCQIMHAKSAPILPDHIFTSIGIGLSCALGAGVKSSGILCFLFAIIVCALLFAVYPWARKAVAQSTLLISLIFLSVMIFFHPFLYQDTAKNFVRIFTDRIVGSIDMRALYTSTAINSPGEAVIKIITKTLLPFGQYNSFPLPGVDFALFITGVILSIKKLYATKKNPQLTPEILHLIFAFLTFTTLTFYLKNDWSRYYLPFIFSLSLIQSWAVEYIVLRLGKKFWN